jgi:hypothetical protein
MRSGEGGIQRNRPLCAFDRRVEFQTVVMKDAQIVPDMLVGRVQFGRAAAGGERIVVPPELAVELAQIAE